MVKDMFGNNRYKVGLHTHTTLSDGRMTPEQAAKIYYDAGYDAIALTDHWVYGEQKTLSGLTILSGCEYNVGASDTAVDVMHIVGVGMKEDPQLVKTTASRQQIIDAINDCGGLAILAHPAWSLNTPQEANELYGFAATEIYNSVSDVGMSSRPYSGYFVDLLSNLGTYLPLVATDDTHYYEADAVKSYIMVESEDGSAEGILAAIRRGAYYATQGPELHVRREGDTIIADCSPCVTIDFLTNSAWAAGKMTRGKDLIHAEYQLKKWEKWVRVEVKDANGNYAWSSVIAV